MEDINPSHMANKKKADNSDGNFVVLKLSIKTREESLIEEQLEGLLRENGMCVLKTLSDEDPTIRFLQVYLEANPAQVQENCIASSGKAIQVLYEMILELQCGLHGYKPEESVVSQLRKKKVVTEIFPMHNRTDRQALMKTWVSNFWGKQPIFAINEYFGTDIATYFSWMGFYTTSLLFPCLIGMTQKAHQYYNPGAQITWISVLCVITNFFWAAFFLLGWGSINDNVLPWSREKNSKYVKRSQYSCQGWMPQRVKQIFSLLVTVIMFCLLIASSYSLLKLDYATKETLIAKNEYPNIPRFITKILIYIPEILLSMTIIAFDMVYTSIAERLTNWENYKFTNTHENALTAKLISFRLFNAFHTLLYIAFVLKDLELLEVRMMNLLIVQQIKSNVGEVLGSDLRVRLLQVLVSLVLVSFLSEGFVVSVEKLLAACGVAIVLYIVKKLFLGNLKFPKFLKMFVFVKVKNQHVSSVEKESRLRDYDSTYLDYLEMLIQYGYILLFSPVYPLAAVFALGNNLIEIHTDAFRLVKMSKRPFPTYATPSKFWQHGFTLMTICGVVTNSQIIRNSMILGHMPLKRSIFVFCVIFLAAYIGMRKFFKGVERNIEQGFMDNKKD